MQAVGHELFLQLGQVVADLVGQQVVVGRFEADAAYVEHIGHRGFQFGLEVQFDDLFAHRSGGLRLERFGGSGLVALDDLAQHQQLVVERRRGERRRQVVDDHRQAASLGLRSLADTIDDVRVDSGQVGGDQARVIVGRQTDGLAGQEFVGRMAADMNHGIGLEAVAQPVVEGEILVRWRDAGIGVQQLFIDLPATRRLRADEDVAEAQAGHQQLATIDHDLARCGAPALEPLDAVAGQAFGQGCEAGAALAGAISEASLIAGFERVEVADGLLAFGVIGPFDKVMQLLERGIDPLAADAALVGRFGFERLGVQAAERAVAHFALNAGRQFGEPAGVVGSRNVSHGTGQFAQRGAIFRQVDAVRHDAVEQCFR